MIDNDTYHYILNKLHEDNPTVSTTKLKGLLDQAIDEIDHGCKRGRKQGESSNLPLATPKKKKVTPL